MGKERVPLQVAAQIAEMVRTRLAPACVRLEVAGSIRRGRPDVADIELLAIPRIEAGQQDLFGATLDERDLLHERCTELLRDGSFAHRPDKNGRPAFGERFKRLLVADCDGMPLDLFCVKRPAQWGVLLAIRTGPAEFSHKLVTSRLLGGWLPAGFQVKDGAICGSEGPLLMPEEEDVFAFLDAPFLPPERRTDTVTLLRAKGQPAQWVDRAAVSRSHG